MAKRQQSADSGVPAWMMTMSDMNTLLLTFFVMLVSMMSLDKPSSSRLTEALHVAGNRFRSTEGLTQVPSVSKTETKKHESDADSSSTTILNLKGIDIQITRTAYGIKYTMSSPELAFNEGDWQLSDKQIIVLIEISKMIHGFQNEIFIYGHCDASEYDSVVVSSDSISVITKESIKYGNKEILGLLRAISVQKYISNPKQKLYIREDKILPVSYSDKQLLYKHPISAEERAKNRRVEIFVSELKSK